MKLPQYAKEYRGMASNWRSTFIMIYWFYQYIKKMLVMYWTRQYVLFICIQTAIGCGEWMITSCYNSQTTENVNTKLKTYMLWTNAWWHFDLVQSACSSVKISGCFTYYINSLSFEYFSKCHHGVNKQASIK